jgi:hypothetical protein
MKVIMGIYNRRDSGQWNLEVKLLSLQVLILKSQASQQLDLTVLKF